MKNYLKILPVAAGLALALVGTTSSASNDAASSEEEAFGYCKDDGSFKCGVTPQGIPIYGRWTEGPNEWPKN